MVTESGSLHKAPTSLLSCDILVEDSFSAPSLVYFPVKPRAHYMRSGRVWNSNVCLVKVGVRLDRVSGRTLSERVEGS